MPEFTPELIVAGFVWYVVFLFSTTCHEASHALVAKLGGDETAALGGQITLNPVPHIRREPFGMVVVPVLAFLFSGQIIGWASAPFNPDWERRYPHRSAWMAMAGPAANFTLMLIAVALIHIGRSLGWFHGGLGGQPSLLGMVVQAFYFLNLLLGVFNLLPVPPLDGSTGIMLFMGENAARGYLDWLRTSPYRLVGLLVAFYGFRYIYGPIEAFATRVLIYGEFWAR
jgi:Zn-dependent protease